MIDDVYDVYRINCEYCDKRLKGNDIVFLAKLTQDIYEPFCSSKCRDDYFKDCKAIITLYGKLFNKEYDDSEQYTCVDTYTVNNIVRMRDKYHKHATIPVVYGDGSPAEKFLGIEISLSYEIGSLTYPIQQIKSELEEAMEYKSKGYTIEPAPALPNIYHVHIVKEKNK